METTKKFASMNSVVMKKAELLQKLIINKAKHDTVLATAIAGYWELAKEKLEQKRIYLIKSVDEYKDNINHKISKIADQLEAKEIPTQYLEITGLTVDLRLNLVYPEDHSKDYDRAIAIMEASIYEEVELTVDEFDAYVLNNWEWKKNFLALNSGYITAMKGKKINFASNNIGNQYENLYSKAASDNLVMCSGAGTITGQMF